jgi:hypothetical protein
MTKTSIRQFFKIAFAIKADTEFSLLFALEKPLG